MLPFFARYARRGDVTFPLDADGADQGDLAGAAAFYEQATALQRAVGDERGAATTLLNAAGLDDERGDVAAARQKIGLARQMFAALRLPLRVVAADLFLARLAREAGDYERAQTLAQSALGAARSQGESEWTAAAARSAANALLARASQNAPLSGDSKRAILALIMEAQRADERSGLAASLVSTLGVRAQVLERSGDADGALDTLLGAIARFERIRATAGASGISEQKSNYGLYDRAVKLALKQGRAEQAFDLLSRARSKKLNDSLRLATLKTPDAGLQRLLDRLAALEARLGATSLRLASENALPAPRRDPLAIRNLEILIATTQAQFFEVSDGIKARNPRFEASLSLSPLELRKAQRALPAVTLLLQFAALDDGLYIFAVTRRDLKIFHPAASKTELQNAVRAYRGAIESDLKQLDAGKTPLWVEAPSPLFEATRQLSKWLLEPLQNEIAAAKTVAIMPSGELFYLPFHALGRRDGGRWRFLIEDKPVAYLAAGDVLSVMAPRDEEGIGEGVLALGDPTGAELPAARAEVAAIARLFANSRAWVGASASKTALVAGGGRDKRIVHLAAHGVLDGARPNQSYIQLSPAPARNGAPGDDGRLRVGEIRGLDLSRVDLVTLSACQTALGQGTPDGAEISSLANSFSGAGTLSVVASLWNVEDASTGRLMEHFYRALSHGQAKGVALQGAQRALLRDPKTRHPLFWAPFELLGDWR